MKATYIIRKWLYGSDYLLAVFYGTHERKKKFKFVFNSNNMFVLTFQVRYDI